MALKAQESKIQEVSMDRIRVPSRLIRYGIVLTHTIRMALKDVESRLEEMDDEEPKPKAKRTRRAKAA
jgi:hypothetical protein